MTTPERHSAARVDWSDNTDPKVAAALVRLLRAIRDLPPMRTGARPS